MRVNIIITRWMLLLQVYRKINNLKVDEAGCLDDDGNRVLLFSKQFKKDLSDFYEKGYRSLGATVDYMLYWEEEEKGSEVPIIFPILELER